jgi:hypothetical protein
MKSKFKSFTSFTIGKQIHVNPTQSISTTEVNKRVSILRAKDGSSFADFSKDDQQNPKFLLRIQQYALLRLEEILQDKLESCNKLEKEKRKIERELEFTKKELMKEQRDFALYVRKK